jgi:hypothetical protein
MLVYFMNLKGSKSGGSIGLAQNIYQLYDHLKMKCL